ncbi:aldehyde ferredoxin oxidoreductase [Candidatus Geothermarchaeota archaeon ex4572_27]|nr:MAG: aldehyde ferredoxin oxidoreductase [Candidatus Geothermarchaeota archaeon ex4572_27]
MFKGGWSGRILWIDLERRKYTVEHYDPSIALSYVGGRGLAIRLLWDHMRPGANPLSPDNLLIFAVGPLTGLPIPSSGKLVVAAKSPLTGGYGDGNVGCRASVHIRRCGVDAIVVRGRAERPIYLHIEDGKVEFVRADDLWGLDASETHDRLEREHGRDCGILCIGPAGERLVRYAVVMSERDRAGGRPGMGAVMGSKNLKALVIRGTGEIPVFDEKGLRELGAEGYREVRSSELYGHWMKEGTMSVLEWCQTNSVLPTRNFREGVFEEAEKITGAVMAERFKVAQKGCPNCNMVCGNVAEAREGRYRGTRAEMDYENVAMLGPNLGIGDMNGIIALIRKADNYGLDTISAGSVIAFTIEAFERGLVKEGDLDGIRPEWGDVEAALGLMDLIVEGRKFGAAMRMGTRYMAVGLGGGSEEFAMNVKGLEISAYDCHIAYGMALAYGTSPIGAHHKDAWFITKDIEIGIDDASERKVSQVIWMQRVRGGMFETLVTCRFPWIELGFKLEWYPRFFYAATGQKVGLDWFYEVADRIYTLIRLFWIREYGYWDLTLDIPPMRWFKHPLTKGPYRGRKLSLDRYLAMLRSYYRMRGWDERGIPTKSTAARLGLSREASAIESMGIRLSQK